MSVRTYVYNFAEWFAGVPWRVRREVPPAWLPDFGMDGIARGGAVAIGEADWTTAECEQLNYCDGTGETARLRIGVAFASARELAWSKWQASAPAGTVEIAQRLRRDRWRGTDAELTECAELLAHATCGVGWSAAPR